MTTGPGRSQSEAEQEAEAGEILELPTASNSTAIALDELELVYAFIYARVGNRPDAEDLTQQVAMKAIPRLRPGSPARARRAYPFASSRALLVAVCGTGLGWS